MNTISIFNSPGITASSRFRRTAKSCAIIALVVQALAAAAKAAPIPPGDLPNARMAPAFPNLEFTRPLCLVHANDSSGRLFVVEQQGRIRVFPGKPDVKSAAVFFDLTGTVRTVDNEEGLLALVFHPQYRRNGYFFVYYSASDPLRSVLSRFQVSPDDPNRAEPKSEKVILEVRKPYGNHNGATLLFGPDGYLYVSIGDGGSAGDPHGNGQNLGVLLAKILRLDVDHADSGRAYAIPPDNPFVGRKGARGEIWAWGFAQCLADEL